MKKLNIFLFMLMALALQSCLHDDKDSFSDSAAERMQKRLIENEATLRTAPNGWLMKYYPNQNKIYGGYTLLVKFNEANKVEIMSERGGHTKVVESLYSMVSDSGPVLRFDTHNELLHYFAEPKNPDGIGPADSGMQGDYEFVIIEATAEKITMKGKKTGNTIVMLPIPAEKDWEVEMLSIVNTGEKVNQYMRYKLTAGNFVAASDIKYRTLNIPTSTGKTEVAPYIITAAGLELFEPLRINGTTSTFFKLVEESNDIYLIDEKSGVRLDPMPLPLSMHLLSDFWSFSYNGAEADTKALFKTLCDEKFNPRNLNPSSIALGTLLEYYILVFFFTDNEGNESDTNCILFMELVPIDDTTVKLVFKPMFLDDTSKELYYNCNLSLLTDQVSGIFKLTADDLFKPSVIRFEKEGDKKIAFSLNKGLKPFGYN